VLTSRSKAASNYLILNFQLLENAFQRLKFEQLFHWIQYSQNANGQARTQIVKPRKMMKSKLQYYFANVWMITFIWI